MSILSVLGGVRAGQYVVEMERQDGEKEFQVLDLDAFGGDENRWLKEVGATGYRKLSLGELVKKVGEAVEERAGRWNEGLEEKVGDKIEQWGFGNVVVGRMLQGMIEDEFQTVRVAGQKMDEIGKRSVEKAERMEGIWGWILRWIWSWVSAGPSVPPLVGRIRALEGEMVAAEKEAEEKVVEMWDGAIWAKVSETFELKEPEGSIEECIRQCVETKKGKQYEKAVAWGKVYLDVRERLVKA